MADLHWSNSATEPAEPLFTDQRCLHLQFCCATSNWSEGKGWLFDNIFSNAKLDAIDPWWILWLHRIAAVDWSKATTVTGVILVHWSQTELLIIWRNDESQPISRNSSLSSFRRQQRRGDVITRWSIVESSPFAQHIQQHHEPRLHARSTSCYWRTKRALPRSPCFSAIYTQ